MSEKGMNTNCLELTDFVQLQWGDPLFSLRLGCEVKCPTQGCFHSVSLSPCVFLYVCISVVFVWLQNISSVPCKSIVNWAWVLDNPHGVNRVWQSWKAALARGPIPPTCTCVSMICAGFPFDENANPLTWILFLARKRQPDLVSRASGIR